MAVSYKDYYALLGVDRSADKDTIARAFKKLAKKYHPDLNPGDKKAEEKFKEINEAYEVLKDPKKRQLYDQLGPNWQQGQQFDGFGGFGGFGGQGFDRGNVHFSFNGRDMGGMGGGDFSDFFENLFGGHARSSRRSAGYKGSDYTAELHLSLRDAARTHKQTLSVNGRNIRITVPAGMADGQVIKLKGQGGPGANGGPAGDLYITFVVEPDPVFTRRGNDLYATADIDLYTAVLGGEATIDTLDGKVKLKVAPETQNGTKVRLRGKGFPVYKQEGQCGDLIVTYNVKLPAHLTERQKELFRQLANS